MKTCRLAILTLLILVIFGVAWAGPSPRTGDGNRDSASPSISADGRYVVFASQAFNLIPGDINRREDVFLYDRATGETVLISRADDGAQGDFESSAPVISANGRYVAYMTWSSNLLPEEMFYNGIVVLDRVTGELDTVSQSTAGELPYGVQGQPSISADGRYVTFVSNAPNLIDNLWAYCDSGNPDCSEVFLHDRQTGETIVLSRNALGQLADDSSHLPVISTGGQMVVFDSLATNLLDGQPGAPDIPPGIRHVYAYDLASGKLSLVSRAGDGAPANGESYAPTVSPDGRLVAFASTATNLAPVAPAVDNVFLHDRDTGETSLISRGTGGAHADSGSWAPAFATDGGTLAFSSLAGNLVPDDVNGRRDIFVYDLDAATLTLVSRHRSGLPSDGDSENPAVSDGGRFIAFETYATNLGNSVVDGVLDVALLDREREGTTWVTARSPSLQGNSESRSPAISADGRFVAFDSYANNLVVGDNNGFWDIFVYDRQTGFTSLIGRGGPAIGHLRWPVISADGRYVAFESDIPFGSQEDTHSRVYIYDRQTGLTELVSRGYDGSPANNWSNNPALSHDGRYVVFHSLASNLVPDDDEDGRNIFFYDHLTRALTRLSWESMNLAGAIMKPGKLAVSADGRYIAFTAAIGVGDWHDHVFIFDRISGETTRVTPQPPADFALSPQVGNFSADSRFLVYASDMVLPNENDTNDTYDVFVYDRETGLTKLVSRSSSGELAQGSSNDPTISADGRYVAFESYSKNLAPITDHHPNHVYLHDRLTGETRLMSAATGLPQFWNHSENALSADGRWLVVATEAALVAGDSNGYMDTFLVSRADGHIELLSGLILPEPYRVYSSVITR